ncbi:hypothetical protein TrCOL_g2919 [Triparma columacea]|uniref:GOST seven transmembrane domain-containing protein n=1 Tax=Triparma columacea TaxID=722753 RepID=A0A9W7LBH4_9STRA|nr:hypothetical protein TrCOL_g2919 [Triparma columacea]
MNSCFPLFLLLLLVPTASEIISLTSSGNFAPISPDPSFEGFGTILRSGGTIDWTGVEFRRDCGVEQDCTGEDPVDVFIVTFPMPLECYFKECDVSAYGLSTDPLCDANKEPMITSPDVIVDSLTLSTFSGRFKAPTTVPKDWYYASVIIVCETEITVFGSGDIYIVDPVNNLLLNVFTSVVPSYSFLTVAAGLTWVALVYLVVKNSKKDILLLHYQMMALLPIVTISYALNAAMYSGYKSSGSRLRGIGVSSILFSVLGKTSVRTLVLPLCMGLGISTQTLSKRTWLVITGIGVTYAITEGAYEILDSTTTPVDMWSASYANWTVVLNFVSTGINVLLWVYSWEGLNGTIAKLTEERQHYKVKRFQSFKRFLMCLLLFAVVMTLVGMALWADPWLSGLFYGWFIQEGWSEFAYLLLMMFIVVIWRPVSNLGELAGVVELSAFDDDDDDGDWDGGWEGEDEEEGGGGEPEFDMSKMMELASDDGEEEEEEKVNPFI